MNGIVGILEKELAYACVAQKEARANLKTNKKLQKLQFIHSDQMVPVIQILDNKNIDFFLFQNRMAPGKRLKV